jgi:hypothetical protein
VKLRTLINVWGQLNAEVFAGVLYPPCFYSTRSRNNFAGYAAGIDCESDMYFNLKHILGRLARSTVYHEMIHQYVEEYLGIEEENDHGPIFLKQYDKFKPADIGVFDCE